MKRVLICLGWFMIINCILGFIGGAVAAVMTGAHGAAEGAQAGRNFGLHYGGRILIGSLFIAVIGTLTQQLPYTRKEE